MDNLKKITCWSRIVSGDSRHNHIEDDWVDGDSPIPKFETQRGWASYKWEKTHCYLNLDNLKIIYKKIK